MFSYSLSFLFRHLFDYQMQLFISFWSQLFGSVNSTFGVTARNQDDFFEIQQALHDDSNVILNTKQKAFKIFLVS